MHIIAHRGASAHEPENTLRAFDRALALGADWIELDLHLTLDGHAVVSHSDDLADATDGRGLISRSTLEQVRRVDAGEGERLPTLAEVLEAFGRRCGLYLELKAPGTAAAAAGLLRCRPAREVILASFRPELLAETAEAAPHLPTSYLVSDVTADLVRPARAVGAAFIHPCWERSHATPHVLLTREMVRAAGREGIGVVVWHEERPEELAHLVRLPVWGICTNAPELLVQAVRGGAAG